MDRKEYSNPQIELAVAQVVLTWPSTLFEDICIGIRKHFDDGSNIVADTREHKIEFLNNGESSQQSISTTFGGTVVKFPETTHELIIDTSGFRFLVKGQPYPGRDYIIKLMTEVGSLISKLSYALPVRRVSLLYKNRISVKSESFVVEDYVVPRFELADSNLSRYLAFRHQLFIDTSDIYKQNSRCHWVLSCNIEEEGVVLTIDMLDDNETTLGDLESQLYKLKDAQTHIFESSITDLTRQQYGIRN